MAGSRDAEMVALQNQAMQAGMEQGRAMGQQEGAQMVLAKLQEHAAQEHATQAHAPHDHHEHKEHKHEHHVESAAMAAHAGEGAKKSFADSVTQRRDAQAAAAAAGAQIG